MLSKTTNRPGLNSVDGQRAAMDAPAGLGAQIFVVVAQMPDQVRDSPASGRCPQFIGEAPMMGDTGNAAQRVIGVRSGGVDLADDRVFGAVDSGKRAQRRAHAVVAPVPVDGLKESRRVGQPQFGGLGEQFDDLAESAVIDRGGVDVYQVGQRQPVRDAQVHLCSASLSAHADNTSLASSMSVVGGIASTTRCAPSVVSFSARSASILVTR